MENDIVETSDLEELEELRAPLRGVGHRLDSADKLSRRDEEHPPRKRVKLNKSPALDEEGTRTALLAVSEPQILLPYSINSLDEPQRVRRRTSLPHTPDFIHGSQDPLLLTSSDPLFSPSAHPRSRSPHSDLGPSLKHKHESPTKFSPLSISTNLGSSEFRRLFSEEREDGTMDQPPSTTPPLHSTPLSPLTPRSSSHLPVVQPLPSHQPPHSNRGSNFAESHGSEQMDNCGSGVEPRESNTSRYSLRRRQAAQIAPYTVDKRRYMQSLRHNPDAIVKARSPERNRRGPLDHYDDDEACNDSQETEGMASTRSPINPEQAQSETTETEQDNVPYPELLQSPSDTDEDNEEAKAISREVQKVCKARKAREAKLKRQGAETSRRTRPFPLANATEDTIAEDMSNFANTIARYDDPIGNVSAVTPSIPNSPSPRYGHTLKDDYGVGQSMELDATSASEAENLDNSHGPQPRASGSASSSVLDKKSMRILGHMMPRSMANQVLYQEKSTTYPKQRTQRSVTVSSEDEYNLPPGRTKVRKTLLTPQQIGGDPERFDDSRQSEVIPDSDVEFITRSSIPNNEPQMKEDHDVLSLSGSESETDYSVVESSSEGVGVEDIRAYLEAEDGAMENENLIDRMLTRTSTFGNGCNTRTNARPLIAGNKRPRERRCNIDVITHGARKYGKEKQLPLNFHSHKRDPTDNNGFRPRPSKAPREHRRYTPPSSRTKGNTTARDTQKRKSRHRQICRNTNGVYTFNDEGRIRIISGRNEDHATVFQELEVPVAPFQKDWADAFRPSESRPAKSTIANTHTSAEHRQLNVPMDTSNHKFAIAYDETESRRQRADVEMGIRMLPSGLSFNPDTFIGKGWLHELIGTLSTRASPAEPCHLHGYGLRLDMGCESFLNRLENVCEDLLEFSIGLPEVEHTEQLSEWSVTIHIVCQFLSWYHGTGDDNQRQQLLQKIEIYAQTIVNRVRDLNLDRRSLDVAFLQLEWFTIELLARAHSTSRSAASSSIFHKSLSLLIDHLVELDAHSALASVTLGDTLDSSTLQQRSAELWVCLLHLLGIYQNVEGQQRGNVSLWSLLLTRLQTREGHSVFEDSETVWRTIFSLCALSQFSVHGMTTSQPRLPASWAVVLFALKKVHLAADLTVDQKLPTPYLVKRDKYITILLLRCFRLYDEWQWQLEDAPELFNELGEVFRSRKFANLLHERPDYPHFMLHQDWSRLLQHGKEDSAFMLFLKFVVKAIKSGQGTITPPKFKKLLSLAIPNGSLPFSKEMPPSLEELPMLFNRLSAIAIGIYLDPSSYKTRLSHARTYVVFSNADPTTRVAVIRGMVNLAILMKKIDLPLDATAEWITEISSTLSAELKMLPVSNEGVTGAENVGKNLQLTIQDGTYICVQVLLRSVRRILDYHNGRDYPDPALIWSIRDLLVKPRESKTICELQKLVEILHKVRNTALHSPELQPIRSDNTESPNEVKEKNLYNAIEKTHLVWFCWQNLAEHIQKSNDRVLDQWIYCWLGCIDILVRNSKTRWSSFLSLPKNLKVKNDATRRRVDLSIATHLLRLYPMIYIDYTDMFLEVFFESLAVDEPTTEHEYISLLISTDGLQHPLLRELTCFNGLNRSRCNISSTEFSSLQLPILSVVLISLNDALDVQGGAELNPGVQKYIDYCIKCFSTMRNILSRLEKGSGARTTYLKWCKQVFASLQGLDNIISHQKLADFLGWGRSFENS